MKISKSTVSYIATIAVVFLICGAVSRYLVQLTLVQGDSMEPAYRNGQLVVLSKSCEEYDRGEVILFDCKSLGCALLKRIAACGGDTVEIKDGSLYVNRLPVDGYTDISYAGIASEELLIPEGCYFVLGDKLEVSKDSRYDYIGIISGEDILGCVIGTGKWISPSIHKHTDFVGNTHNPSE